MKRIEDIESMSPEALEAAAMEQNVSVPEGFEDRIREALAGEAAARQPRKVMRRRVFYSTVAAAAALTAVVFATRTLHTPRDTFDDPYRAYAQVEETFRQISEKMAFGLELADEAKDTAEKPFEVIKKISEK